MTTGSRGAQGGGPREPMTEPIVRQPAPAPAPNAPDRLPPRRLLLLVVMAVVTLVADLATKITVVATLHDGQRVPVLGDGVALTLVRNPGAAFSLATGLTWVLTLVAVAVVVGIVRYARRLRSPGWAVALGLVLGGAVGNLMDRFFRGPGPFEGHVVDFVSIGWWPVFNVADSSICLGGAVLVVLALWGREIDGTSRYDHEPEPRDPNALDEDDEKVALVGRPKYPKRRWDPMPGTPRYLSDGAGPDARLDARPDQEPDEDDLLDEDDRLPGRTRHAANKWEQG